MAFYSLIYYKSSCTRNTFTAGFGDPNNMANPRFVCQANVQDICITYENMSINIVLGNKVPWHHLLKYFMYHIIAVMALNVYLKHMVIIEQLHVLD